MKLCILYSDQNDFSFRVSIQKQTKSPKPQNKNQLENKKSFQQPFSKKDSLAIVRLHIKNTPSC